MGLLFITNKSMLRNKNREGKMKIVKDLPLCKNKIKMIEAPDIINHGMDIDYDNAIKMWNGFLASGGNKQNLEDVDKMLKQKK